MAVDTGQTTGSGQHDPDYLDDPVIDEYSDFGLFNTGIAQRSVEDLEKVRVKVDTGGVAMLGPYSEITQDGLTDEQKERKKINEAIAIRKMQQSSFDIAATVGRMILSSADVSNSANNQIARLQWEKEFLEGNKGLYIQVGPDGQPLTQDQIDSGVQGRLMTPDEVTKYEEENGVCIADPNKDKEDLARTEDLLAQLQGVVGKVEAGEDVDLSTLDPEVAKTLVRDKVTSQIKAGEPVNVNDLPEEYRDVAISTILSHELDDVYLETVKKYGITEEEWRNGALLDPENKEIVDKINQDIETWKEARTAEILANGTNAPARVAAVDTERGPAAKAADGQPTYDATSIVAFNGAVTNSPTPETAPQYKPADPQVERPLTLPGNALV